MPKIGHDATRSVKNGAPRAPIARSEKTAQGCHWAGNLPWWFSSDAACREQRACVLGGGERVLSRDSDARCCCCRVGHRRAPAPDPAQREHPQRRQTTTTSTVQSIQLASNKNNNRFGLCRHLVFARRARRDGGGQEHHQDRRRSLRAKLPQAGGEHRAGKAVPPGVCVGRIDWGVCARGRGGGWRAGNSAGSGAPERCSRQEARSRVRCSCTSGLAQ